MSRIRDLVDAELKGIYKQAQTAQPPAQPGQQTQTPTAEKSFKGRVANTNAALQAQWAQDDRDAREYWKKYDAEQQQKRKNRSFWEDLKNMGGAAVKGVGKSLVAGGTGLIGAGYGFLSDLYNESNRQGWWSLVPGTKEWRNAYGAALKGLKDGAVVGAKAGWRDADRAGADAIAAVSGLGNSLFLVPNSVNNRVQRWDHDYLLKSMRGAGVKIPDEIPRDPYTGLMLPTGDPKYKMYDEFLMAHSGGRHSDKWWGGLYDMVASGQGAAQTALATALGAGLTSGAAKALPSSIVKAKPALPGWIGYGMTDAVLPSLRGYSDARDVAQRDPYIEQQVYVLLDAMQQMDPSTEEYKDLYWDLIQYRNKYPMFGFNTLHRPTSWIRPGEPEYFVR